MNGSSPWRAVEEILDADAVGSVLGREPPPHGKGPDGHSRRDFIRLLGGSAALAGLGACAQPAEHILPYVEKAPETTPGRSDRYATSMSIDGRSTGLLVESRDGRPIKVEGNPEHPASLGASSTHAQASLLQLYDPHRSRSVRRGGERASWPDLVRALDDVREAARDSGGRGLALLMEPTGSPLEAEILDRLRDRFPSIRTHFHSPLTARGARDGAREALGRPLDTVLNLGDADVVVSLDADFLGGEPYPVRYAHDFAAGRRIHGPDASMNRLYTAEGMLTPTGAAADHRLGVRSGEIHALLAALLAAVLEVGGGGGPGAGAAGPGDALPTERLEDLAGRLDARTDRWIGSAARDLTAAAGRSAVVVGERQPAEAHALGHLLNAALGNLGRTVRLIEPPVLDAGPETGLPSLAGAMESGEVEWLLVLGGNPSYTAPADLELGEAIRELPWSFHLGMYRDETSADCVWSAPQAHYLESWGDGRAFDGTVSLVQPLIRPLHGGRSVAELLAALLDDETREVRALLRERWRERLGGGDEGWERALRAGLLPDTASPPVEARPRWEALTGALPEEDASGPDGDGLEVSFVPDPRVLGGRFSNNAWLQELPDPITKLTWDNAALVSVATADRLGLRTGDVVRLRWRGSELEAPVMAVPGHADASVSLPLGYGRRAGAEEVAEGVGFDAYRLRTADSPWFAPGLEIEAVPGSRHALATTQRHGSMEGRDIVMTATLEEYRERPGFTELHRGPQPSLYSPFEEEREEDDREGEQEHQEGGEQEGEREGGEEGERDRAEAPQWAMAIDLSACTGCSACVVACQAENNIPVVGKEGVLNSREMHWIRIDRYFEGPPDDPEVSMQPMLCQHCEKAPCEYVCPVNATVHSHDGLNEMIYNRCVGTRFCSNNCPYKVRRFNWFDYNRHRSETEEMAMNPDVTVRGRGVIEKCTFCVQRIRRAGIEARNEDRPLRPSEVRTACQQACPTRAISFGSLTDPHPELARRLEDPRRYSVLHELGTRPRVTYLARIKNPGPEAGDG